MEMTGNFVERLQRSLGNGISVERELGGGGMARVFLARDNALGRPIVVKALAPESTAAVNVERFRREIRLAASLQHPNIVPVHSAGDADGTPYFTMSFVDGETLRARLNTVGPFSIREAIGLFRDIARALEFAHHRGVVHRDIKPENILLSGNSAVVTDFGIAKALEDSRAESAATTLTQRGVTLGTPRYMSPEQARADESIDHRADLYAFGVVAYEVLTGRPPFVHHDLAALLVSHVTQSPVDVREHRSGIPGELARLVMKCLEKRPRARPESAAEILRVLDSVAMLSSGDRDAMEPRIPAKPMLVVLPFANISGSGEEDYFSDGITEDLIAQLSQLAGLRVISRTSAMRYKHSDLSVKDIAATLGATHVLEGSVRRAGARLRIIAKLIEASSDAHLWAQTFDRELSDVFAVQSEVAERIAAALRTRLEPSERTRLARQPTTDQEAYNLFLLARHHMNNATADGFGRAIQFHERAVERDPRFARGWAALARAHHFHLAGYFGVRPRDAASKVVQFASRALELDTDVAEAHMMLGYVDEWIFLDHDSAGSRLERALALSPNLADTHLAYGNHLVILGRYAEAMDAVHAALELDPASEYVHLHANWLRYLTRHFDAALAGLEAAEAQFGWNLLPLVHGEALMAVGRQAEAVDILRALCERAPITLNLCVLAWSLASAGRRSEAHALLTELHERETREYVWPIPLGPAYAELGDMDRAMRYIECCVEDRVAWIHMPYAPTFDVVRQDSRFETMVRPLGARPPAA